MYKKIVVMRYFELNCSKNLAYQNLRMPFLTTEKFIVLNEYIRKRKVEIQLFKSPLRKSLYIKH